MAINTIATAAQIKAAILAGLEEAGDEGGETVLDMALQEVPRDTEALANSGTAETYTAGTDRVAATISFGSDDVAQPVDYAERQHEDLTYSHPNGGKAKYLEDPLYEYAPRWEAVVAKNVLQKLLVLSVATRSLSLKSRASMAPRPRYAGKGAVGAGARNPTGEF